MNRINFVVNSLEPYQFEVPNILALPKGTIFRLRYESNWVEQTSVNADSIENKMEGVIYFNHSTKFTSLNDANGNPYSEYYPIRRIFLLDYKILGSIYYFECELGDYFDYPSGNFIESNDHSRLAASFANKNLVFVDQNNRIIENFESNSKKSDDENKRWFRTVSSFSNIAAYNDLDFYRVSRIANCKSGEKEEVKVVDGAFNLNEGDSYEIYVTHFRKKASFDVDLYASKRGINIVESAHIVSTQSFAMALGKYDILKLVFSLEHVKTEINGILQLSYVVSDALSKRSDNTIRVPIRIQKQIKPLRAKLLFLLFIMLLYIVPNFVPISLSSFFTAKVIQDLAVVAFTATLVDLINTFRSNNG